MPERPTDGVTAHVTIRDRRGGEALDFYARAFGAETTEEHASPDGRLMFAALRISGGWLMLNDDFPEWAGGVSPPPGSLALHLQVDDADAWFARAVEAGAVAEMPVADQFWGDRYGRLRDPFGFLWSLGSPIR